jgi:hypothetical protein
LFLFFVFVVSSSINFILFMKIWFKEIMEWHRESLVIS